MTGPEIDAGAAGAPLAGRTVVAGLGLLGIAVAAALVLGGPDPRILPVDPDAWFDPGFRLN